MPRKNLYPILREENNPSAISINPISREIRGKRVRVLNFTSNLIEASNREKRESLNNQDSTLQ